MKGRDYLLGFVEDFLEALNNWFKGLLADGIIGALNTTNDLLTGALNNSDDSGINGIFSQYLGDVTAFTGSTSSTATPIWDTIESLTKNVIVPIGGFMLMIVLVYELFYLVVENNNFHDTDTSFFIRWIIKAFCGVILVSHIFEITTGIYSFGTKAVNQGLSTLFGKGSFISSSGMVLNGSLKTTLVNNNDIGTLIITLILSFVIIIVTFVLLAAIIIVLAARLIDVYMYLSISPIPMATMMNKDWGDMGRNWLRNVIALAFQGFFIIVALDIFKVLFENTLSSLSNSENIVMSMATLLGFIIALIFTMFRTGNISKSAFGAH